MQGLFTAHVTGNFVTIGAALVFGTSGIIAKLLALPVFCIIIVITRLISFNLPGRGAGLAIGLGPFKNGDAWPAILTGMALVSAMAIQNAVHRIHLGSAPPTRNYNAADDRCGRRDSWITSRDRRDHPAAYATHVCRRVDLCRRRGHGSRAVQKRRHLVLHSAASRGLDRENSCEIQTAGRWIDRCEIHSAAVIVLYHFWLGGPSGRHQCRLPAWRQYPIRGRLWRWRGARNIGKGET